MYVWLQGNPLTPTAVCQQIPVLEARGVSVRFGCSSDCDSAAQPPMCSGTLTEGCPDLTAAATALWLSYGGNWSTADSDSNRVPDSWDLALFQEVLCRPAHLFKYLAVCAYERNLELLALEPPGPFSADIAAYPQVVAAILAASPQANCEARKSWALTGEYHVTQLAGYAPFDAFRGDLDLDGITNRQEALNVMARNGTVQDYVAAALDPAIGSQSCSLQACPDLQAQGESHLAWFWWNEQDQDSNVILDSWEIELFNTILCSPNDPRRQAVVCAYENNLRIIRALGLDGFYSFAAELHAAMLALSPSMNLSWLNLEYYRGPYEVAEFDGAPIFVPGADLDGDGVTNGEEAANIRAIGGTVDDFVRAVMDPTLSGAECDGTLRGPCPSMDRGWFFYSLLHDDWSTGDLNADGIPDRWQILAFADTLCDPTANFHHEAVCVYRKNLATYQNQYRPSDNIFGSEALVVGALSINTEMRDFFLRYLNMFGIEGPYEVVMAPTPQKLPNEPFAADGDLDGDGISNLEEYLNVVANGLTLQDYLDAVRHPLLDGSKPLSSLPLAACAAGVLAGLLCMLGVLTIRRRRLRAK